MAADEAHVPAGVAGVALEHLVRVVIPSAPDAAVVRRVLLGAAAHAAHPALVERLAKLLGEGQKRTRMRRKPILLDSRLTRRARDV